MSDESIFTLPPVVDLEEAETPEQPVPVPEPVPEPVKAKVPSKPSKPAPVKAKAAPVKTASWNPNV